MISSRKWGHFGDTWIAQDFPKISEKSRVIYHHLGRGYSEPLSQIRMPPFSAPFRKPPRGPDFYPKFGQSSDAISSRKGDISATHGLPMFPLKCWQNHGQSIAIWDALFGTLIAAKNAPFPAPFRPSPKALILTQNFGNPQLRLANKRGPFWRPMDYPGFPSKFRGNHGHPIAVCVGPHFEP